VRLVPRAEPVPVILQLGTDAPVSVEVNTSVVDDAEVYLIKVGTEGKVTVDHLNPQMGHALLDKLDPSKEVK